MLHEIEPRKLNIDFSNREITASDYVLFIKKGQAYVKDKADDLTVPVFSELSIEKEDVRYLFCIDELNFYLYSGDDYPEETDIYSYAVVNTLRRHKPGYMSYAVQLCYRLSIWYGNSSYCGRCGHKMEHSHKERAMVCPECRNAVYPTINPSVIVLIRDGERTLLTRYQASHNFYRNYALVAGYIETGETGEQAVAREVMEEVGLKVKNITYYKSQPWPLSGALLLGYVCDLDGDDTIRRDDEELEEALWMNREDLPDRSGDVSLTSDMIESFRMHRL